MKLTFKDIFKKGAILYNPVLVQLVGLCPVIAASASFRQAAILSVAMCAELIVTCVIASALLKGLPRWIRMPLYLIIGLIIICPFLYYLETHSLTGISLIMKIYLPLTAVNSVVAVHCEQFAVKNSVKLAFYDAVASGIGASVIFLITGAVREILGSSSFAGVNISLPVTLKGMSLPFGALILLGFLAAGMKAINSWAASGRENAPEPVPATEQALPEAAQAPAVEAQAEESSEAPEAEQGEKSVSAESYASEELNKFLKSLGIDYSEEGERE